ncbi:MAG: hypothetical protein O3A18_00230 [Planctomycetota bacterium]|jgi:hypothetical protein|nr:hypothetical protein [Planctomycetota bacterium]
MPAARPSQPAAAQGRAFAIVAAALAVIIAAAAAWLLWPREDKLGDVLDMQKQLLAAGGTPSRSEIMRVIQTVDRMDRREVWAAYRAAAAEWKRIKQEAMDAYFAAPQAERPALLDRYIAQLGAYHDLLMAMNPRQRPGEDAYLPRRRRRGEPEPEKTPAEAEAERIRRELSERFDGVVEAYAEPRGIELPSFR